MGRSSGWIEAAADPRPDPCTDRSPIHVCESMGRTGRRPRRPLLGRLEQSDPRRGSTASSSSVASVCACVCVCGSRGVWLMEAVGTDRIAKGRPPALDQIDRSPARHTRARPKGPMNRAKAAGGIMVSTRTCSGSIVCSLVRGASRSDEASGPLLLPAPVLAHPFPLPHCGDSSTFHSRARPSAITPTHTHAQGIAGGRGSRLLQRRRLRGGVVSADAACLLRRSSCHRPHGTTLGASKAPHRRSGDSEGQDRQRSQPASQQQPWRESRTWPTPLCLPACMER